MLRELLISNQIAYGSGYYGSGYYGGFSTVTIANNWHYTKNINSQTTFTFTIIDNPNNLTISRGLEVKFLIDGVIEFAGIINSVIHYEEFNNYLYYDITCTSFDKLIEKRRIIENYTTKTAGYIIKDMITNILSEEGITQGTIENASTFDQVVFNNCSCYEALNKIQVACPGYNWHIDNDKKLHFYSRLSNKSAYTIDNTLQHNGFKPFYTLDEYRNVQYIKGGRKETNLISNYTPTPKPDSSSREFIVKFQIARQPIIETNIAGAGWVAKTVGINGIDTGKDFYWTYGSDKVTQDESGVVLTSADDIRISFYGLQDINLVYEDTTEINTRKVIDGNSGKYEETFYNQDLVTNAAATDYAKGLIDKYKNQNYINLTIENNIYDFDINMLVKVEKTLFAINDWYLIESITVNYQTPEKNTYQLKLLSGESVGNWEDYLKSLLTQQVQITDNDILIKFKSFDDTWTWLGTTYLDVATILKPETTLYPSLILYPGTVTKSETIID